MKRVVLNLIVAVLALLAVDAARADQTVEVKLSDGSRWRGEVGQMVEITYREQRAEAKMTGRLQKAEPLYLVIEGNVAGELRQKMIVREDVVAMRTLGEGESTAPAKSRPTAAGKADPVTSEGGEKELGVFYLPLEGTVGETFRHDEIDMIGKEADKFGPGQIIVLMINSNGGLVYESEIITESIWSLKKNHRVVAWVKKAISAGCATAMVCDEIYFMTDGSAGSVTTIRGLTAVSEKEAQPGIDYMAQIAIEAGYSEHIARAMKLKKYLCSYDKDPETGKVEFYGDLSGEFDLSTDEENLCFNSDNALHCGFSKGTADTEADLAKLLDLPEWREVNDYGRRVAKEWTDTVEKCNAEVPLLVTRRGYASAAGTPEERIGALISINKDLIRWWDRCELPMNLMGAAPPKEQLEREIADLRKELADMKKRR